MLFGDLHSAASISPDGLFRAHLRRTWDETKEPAVFIMLNPSTADALLDDPTIRRCIGFAKSWNLGGIHVVNLFQLRATDPRELASGKPLNPSSADDTIISAMSYSETVIAAWGAMNGHLAYRAREVATLAKKRDKQLYALGLTKTGMPRHPLYLRGDASPQIWQYPFQQ